jgi:hypothetical protein
MYTAIPPYRADRISRLTPPPPYGALHETATWLVVTAAHYEEVEVSANGYASAPYSGAAAVAPPAGTACNIIA